MGRPPRAAPAGTIFHVLNRANRRATLFKEPGDYLYFVRTLADAIEREHVALFAYCVMPNHWHLVVQPPDAVVLAKFVHWLTTKHALAWHAHNGTSGTGHVYQNRFKAFPVQTNEHFLVLCRYVERNPVRAQLVDSAAEWRWSSHRANVHSTAEAASMSPHLSEWPVARPADWKRWVEDVRMDSETADVRRSIAHGKPYGSAEWRNALSIDYPHFGARNPRGRPRNEKDDGARPQLPFDGK